MQQEYPKLNFEADMFVEIWDWTLDAYTHVHSRVCVWSFLTLETRMGSFL